MKGKKLRSVERIFDFDVQLLGFGSTTEMPPGPRSSPSLGLGRPILFCILILVTLLYLVRAPAASPAPVPLKKQPLAAPAPEQESDGVYTQRIIGLGDIHADFPAMTSILRMLKLVDMRGNWIGGNAVIVQTGGELPSFLISSPLHLLLGSCTRTELS